MLHIIYFALLQTTQQLYRYKYWQLENQLQIMFGAPAMLRKKVISFSKENKSGGIFAQAHVLPIVCVNLIKAAPVHCPGRNSQHELRVSSRPSTCGTRWCEIMPPLLSFSENLPSFLSLSSKWERVWSPQSQTPKSSLVVPDNTAPRNRWFRSNIRVRFCDEKDSWRLKYLLTLNIK